MQTSNCKVIGRISLKKTKLTPPPAQEFDKAKALEEDWVSKNPNKLLNPAEAERFAAQACAIFSLPTVPLEFSSNECPVWAFGVYNHKKNLIAFPKSQCDVVTLVHELSHYVQRTKGMPGSPHGDSFLKVEKKLLELASENPI